MGVKSLDLGAGVQTSREINRGGILTKWRCVADHGYSGYCEGEPSWAQAAHEEEFLHAIIGGTCKKTPDTCGKHLTFTEALAPVSEAIQQLQSKIVKKGRRR